MTTLAQYGRVRAALAEATRVDQVLPILDEIEHIKLYARQIEDQALLADAGEYQMKAERRLGFIITEAKKAGHFAPHRPKKNGSDEEPLSATLDDVGVSKKLSSTAQKRSSISEQAFDLTVQAMRDRIASGRAKIIEAPLPEGSRTIMGSRQEPDDSLDYFPTPPWATRALMEHVIGDVLHHSPHADYVWEPACGEGHIAEVLKEYCKQVRPTDIFDYGYGIGDVDFLTQDENTAAGTDWIISNPPFGDLTEQFVLRAIELAQAGVAMFVRLQWLESIGRYENIFRDNPPTLIAFFAERVNLCKGRWEPDGTTATAYIWLVWIKGAEPRAPFWIPRCRKALTRPDDAERFTAHPVKPRPTDSSGSPLTHNDDGEIIDPDSLPPFVKTVIPPSQGEEWKYQAALMKRRSGR